LIFAGPAFILQCTQTPQKPQPIAVDRHFYTTLTDSILDQFYPKFCCNEKLTKTSATRVTVVRCPTCHKSYSKLAGTPLNHLKIDRWMFGYLLKEGQIQYPKVLTIAEIRKRLGVSITTAVRLKRRLQLFASDVMPRMQKKFYTDNKLLYHDFKFPKNRETDLTPIVKDLKIPSADTVVLYSCGRLANKGRKRHKRLGQTSSIYRSESLGADQVGTLVNTLGVKKGPTFYDSIPNSKASTVNPILFKYIPYHNPIFTDEGYSLQSKNHRTVNHSRKSLDKRFKWAQNRFSKNGIHNNVAEGKNGVLKKAFGSHTWINPKHSNLYLTEFAFNANLRYFELDDLLPDESRSNSAPQYQLDENWQLRSLKSNVIHEKSEPLKTRISALEYEAKTLVEIKRLEQRSKIQIIKEQIAKEENPDMAIILESEYERLQNWLRTKPFQDERAKQRYYEALAEKIWKIIPDHGYIELHEISRVLNISGKHTYRVIGVLTCAGLLDTVDLNIRTKSKVIEYFDIRKIGKILTPLRYTVKKTKIAEFNRKWRSKTRKVMQACG